MVRRIASALSALIIFAAGVQAAEPTLEEQLALIEEKVAAAEVWLWDVNYHEDAGFYAFDDARFQTWDTAIALWLHDWMTANGWDVSSYDAHADNARAWLTSVRHEEGFWSHYVNPDDNSDTEATSIAALVAPSSVTDDWLVGGQQPEGYWNIGNPDIEWADYPSVTAHVLHTAVCRGLPVEFEAALAWLDAVPPEEVIPDTAYYSSRFYITYLAAALAVSRPDVPEDLVERMRTMVGVFQADDGSYENRTMLSDPSAIVSTSLALETAIWLDDGTLGDAIRKAGAFIITHVHGNGDHWEGGLWGPGFDKNESLFATVHAVRALVMAHAWLQGSGDAIVVCSEPTPPPDDDDDGDDDDDDDDDDEDGDDADGADDDDEGDDDDDDDSGGCCG